MEVYTSIEVSPLPVIHWDTVPHSFLWPGRVVQSVGHLTSKSEGLGLIPGLATCFCFSFCWFKRGSCQLLVKVCARSTGEPLRPSKPAQEKCG